MHSKKLITSGRKLNEAKKALIMLHGRGASAEDIMALSRHLNVDDFTLIAPQATNHTWYPYSFLAPPDQNEPGLSSALSILNEIVEEVNQAGISSNRIYFLGFSQGACLTLEFVTRNAKRWGGAVAFTGGLIGDKIYKENYKGSFEQTPVFIGTSDPDHHVPVQRVNESTEVLKAMHAEVTLKIYPNMGHTVTQDEIEQVNNLIFKV
jgi:phospholipase/carboxylesterase